MARLRARMGGNVRYVSRGSAYSLFLTSKEAVLVMRQHAKDAAGNTSPAVVRMQLTGANQVPALSGQDELPGKSNYLIGKSPSEWRTGVSNYGRVAEKGVYPGIDLVYHGNQGQLEYDFDVAPQADPRTSALLLKVETGCDWMLPATWWSKLPIVKSCFANRWHFKPWVMVLNGAFRCITACMVRIK